jgi:hypothetical protein
MVASSSFSLRVISTFSAGHVLALKLVARELCHLDQALDLVRLCDAALLHQSL